ncbi:MAG TPA: thermonuclease family protein [Pyrinomonadaceae bacterium]|jgi:endonuclease YncB( thermonuclease family)
MKKLFLLLFLMLSPGLFAYAQDLPFEETVETLKPPVDEQKLVGRVVKVTDGDTITILDRYKQEYKIRLEGIDAPESEQDFGRRAEQNLSDLIFGKTVTVLASKVDKYKRFVGKVLLGDKDINLEQIKAGFARHYKRYAGEQHPADRALYAAAETKARNAKLGLWSQTATAPRDWRKSDEKVSPAASRTAENDWPGPNTPSSRTYIRGPRGGCYYINGSGNKTYVDRSLCD